MGPAILWAVVLGALLKFAVTEGLARFQLATGETLLEGAVHRLGRPVLWLFLPYLLLWSFFVAAALMGACGVTLHALLPVFADAARAKIVFGALSSLTGLALVATGGYRLFEHVMRFCIALMVATVLTTAVLLWPGWAAVARGLLVPAIPDLEGQGLAWTVALIGGVGGTVTVLCYGYWIREEGRLGAEHLRLCRLDLGTGYAVTALFGLAMVIIGSSVEIEGHGATLLVTLSGRLAGLLGPAGNWLFLIGAFGAVFSSLLGVWQAVPYLFADCWALLTRPRDAAIPPGKTAVDSRSLPYRAYLLALAILPMAGLFWSFREMQKLYAVTGAAFIPLLALVLLVLNCRADWVGERFTNAPATNLVLLAVIAFFAWTAMTGLG